MNAISFPVVEPIVPVSRAEPFDDPKWSFQVKYDGFRAIMYFNGRIVRLMSKQGKRLSFPQLEFSLARILIPKAKNLILDGEVVSIDEIGRPIFKNLVSRRGKIVYIAFDLLWMNDEDLRGKPFSVRRKKLEKIAHHTRHDEYLRGAYELKCRGTLLFSAVKEHDLEGMVARRLEDPYVRGAIWYKVLNGEYGQKRV